MKINCLPFLLPLFMVLLSCSKEFDPKDYWDGQLVTVYLDHYIQAESSTIYADAAYERRISTFIEGFSDRELGYRYTVRARVREAPKNLMDVPPYWFVYVKTLDKIKVENKPFVLELAYSSFDGYKIVVTQEDQLHYYLGKYVLKPENVSVANKLEEVLHLAHEAGGTNPHFHATAIASHDPDHWGQAFIVHEVSIEEIMYD